MSKKVASVMANMPGVLAGKAAKKLEAQAAAAAAAAAAAPVKPPPSASAPVVGAAAPAAPAAAAAASAPPTFANTSQAQAPLGHDEATLLYRYAPFFYQKQLAYAYATAPITPYKIRADILTVKEELDKICATFPYIAILGMARDLDLIQERFIKTQDLKQPPPPTVPAMAFLGFGLSDVPLVKRLLLPFLLYLANSDVSNASLYEAANLGGIVDVVCTATGFTSLSLNTRLINFAVVNRTIAAITDLQFALDWVNTRIEDVKTIDFAGLKKILVDPTTPVIKFTTKWNATQVDSKLGSVAGVAGLSGGYRARGGSAKGKRIPKYY